MLSEPAAEEQHPPGPACSRPALGPSIAPVFAHAAGAAAIDAPVWLVAYGAGVVVLLVAVSLRSRLVAGTRPRGHPRDRPQPAGPGPGDGPDRHDRRPAARRGWRAAGPALGVGALVVVTVAALAGPPAPGANLAPPAVLGVAWVGLPLACVVAGDVVGWLDPFGALARALPGGRRARPAAAADPGTAPPRGPAWTAPALLAVWAWWGLAHHDARDPRALGALLLAHTAGAVAGARRWGPAWLRRGEVLGALSAAARRLRRAEPDGDEAPTAALVAVGLGALAFDLFGGTRAWVDLAGTASGWDRTAVATGCLAVAVAAAGFVVAATRRLAAVCAGTAGAAPRAAGAATLAWAAVAAGVLLAHGLTLLLVEGQLALALASDPLGRGWDLLGTARWTIDHSPLAPGWAAAIQLAAVVGGGGAGVALTARALDAERAGGLGAAAALRTLWATGAVLAATTALGAAVLAADLG